MSMFYKELFSKLPFDYSGVVWKAGELESLRWELLKFRTAAEKAFCASLHKCYETSM